MRLSFRAAIVLSVLAISACSGNSSNKSSTVTIGGWVGAQGVNSAQVIANRVGESGQPARDLNEIYVGLRESSDAQGRYNASIALKEITLLIARGQIVNVDKDKKNDATTLVCQLNAGCTSEGVTYGLSASYPATSGFEWHSVVYSATKGSLNNINAITTLADAFAYSYDVKNKRINDVYTAYDVVLANSQLSNLLGLSEIVGDIPANLARLDSVNSNAVGAKNQIRYGALLAGLQQLELAYRANNTAVNTVEFITKVAQEFAADEGQLYFNTSGVERALTKAALLTAAHDNLNAILPSISNSNIKALATQAVNDLKVDLDEALAAPVDTKTTATADDLSKLLTATDIKDIDLGLEKTKLFVKSLVDYKNTLWTDGYRAEIEAYHQQLKTISDTHKDNLNALAAEFARIQDYYVTCIIGGKLCDETKENKGFADLEARKTSYDSATKTLKMDSDKLTISQALADLNVVKVDTLSESNAIDILITGELEVNNLVLKLAHDFNADKTKIDIPSSMRIYHGEKIKEVTPNVDIIGYELIWGDFQLYDKTSIGTATETDLAGAFRIFYRGVKDPQNTAKPNDSELRFNIENWLLNSKVSDTVNTEAAKNDAATLAISAQATNPDVFYPANKFASFNGFFKVNNANAIGDVAPNLLTYKMGKEAVLFGAGSIEVETVDFINALGKDIRYRFYPNELVEDKDDSNGNGNREEKVDLHRVELCDLEKGTDKVVKCGPKSRIYDKRDVQKTINDFWEIGLFQLTEVDGRGTYFVDFPTTDDSKGCKVLQPLQQTGTFDGRLLEQQVLGLNSVRLVSEVSLKNDAGVALPKTLFDVSVVAPKEDRYKINAALSHNYTAKTSDANSVTVGTGSNVNVVRVSYDTSADFKNTGDVSVVKGGVKLTLGDGSTVTEDQNLASFITQTYDQDSISYEIVENEKGVAERCVKTVGTLYVKEEAKVKQAFSLNYRGVVYGTARQEGDQKIWTIRYIDGTWFIPTAGTEG